MNVVADDLRRLIPASTRAAWAEAAAVPLELGVLLGAAAGVRRSLLAFAPALQSLASSSAGILRAARERTACVLLRVELAGQSGSIFPAALRAIAQASDEARYTLPLGVVAALDAEAESLTSGLCGRQVAEALNAGFPSVLLRVTLPVEALAAAEALAPARERELGCAVGFSTLGEAPEDWLRELRQTAVPVVAIAGDVDLALAGHGYRWAPADSPERAGLLRERPPVLDCALPTQSGLRGERAEAAAFFAADEAFERWQARGNAPLVRRALGRRFPR